MTICANHLVRESSIVRIIHRHCANHVQKNNNCANHLVRESSVARIILLPKKIRSEAVAEGQWRSHGGAQGGTCPPYSIQGGLRDSCKSEEFWGGVGEQIRVSTTAV